jgi:hypothetical protein
MYVRKPQITMRTLLLCTASLGIGLGLLLFTIDRWRHGEHSIPPGKSDLSKTLQFFASGVFLGAGIFGLFNRPRLGIYLGVMVETIWCLTCSVAWTGWTYSWRIPIFRIVFVLSVVVIALGCFTLLHKIWLSCKSWSKQQTATQRNREIA